MWTSERGVSGISATTSNERNIRRHRLEATFIRKTARARWSLNWAGALYHRNPVRNPGRFLSILKLPRIIISLDYEHGRLQAQTDAPVPKQPSATLMAV